MVTKTSSSKHKRKTTAKSDVKRLDAFQWNPSVVEDDPFALLAGSNDLEGGFLSLEEIDESEYGFVIPEPGKGQEEVMVEHSHPSKSKKRKVKDVDGGSTHNPEVSIEEKAEDEKKAKRKKKKKNVVPDAAEPEAYANKEVDEESVVDETEFYAWNELRLHPMIMKSIYRLGFREPTPIQKACIPAAAHRGKDVIGAAETGSGKTLAFGLPIVQRLLEEQEKAAKSFSEKGIVLEKSSRGSPLRALIVTPTRELALQVADHLKEVAKVINVRVVPIVGGMSTEKQERLLKARPEIVVGTPGRLWEIMSGGDKHLVELHSLSFFVLDEADRMIENGHFHELQSILDMLPMSIADGHNEVTQNCATGSSVQRKKRQTLVFSATIALSADFRKKLKNRSLNSKPFMNDGISSIETLVERAGMRADAAVIDLTNTSIMADKLEESFIECREEDKDAYLYYIFSVHGQGRTIVFCTSIAALRHISSLLRILGVSVWTLHAQMQQRARLKAVDRFRVNEHGILVATDVAARGLDIPGVRTVVHYQLPHSAEVYVHRSGRTARASADGCSIALISPSDRSKFASLCRSFSKESLQRFPIDSSYIPEVMKRLSLARQIDKILRKDSQEKAQKSWLERSAESIELILEDNDSEEERVNNYKQKKIKSIHLQKLQEELKVLLSCPLQPKTFSRRFLAGAGVSSLLQHQFEDLANEKMGENGSCGESKRGKLMVLGQDSVEPLQALRSAGHEARIDLKKMVGKQRNIENIRRKRNERKRLREQRKKERKRLESSTE